MGHSPSRPPLEIDTSPERPNWYSRSIFAPKYTGRKEWWTELGYTDPVHEKGHYRLNRPFLREYDEWWYDPKVPDGTSIPGPNGMDSKYHKNITFKMDSPGNFYDYHRKITENSRQYKNIAEKFDISKEHPGVDVSPTLQSLDFGTRVAITPNLWYLGPRFWDKPINEGCFMKGLAGAKLGVLATLPFAVGSIINYPVVPIRENQTFVMMAKRYASMAWLPAVLGFTYGISICTSANIRYKDDSWNWVIASATTGFTYASIRDRVSKGVLLFLGGTAAGLVYHSCRLTYRGLQGLVYTPDHFSFWHPGPLAWKFTQWGEAKVPEEKW